MMGRGRWGGKPEEDKELCNVPVSPSSQLFLRKEVDVSIDCFVTFEQPVDVAVVKDALISLANSCSRLRSVLTEERGRLHWKELHTVDIDSLIITLADEDNNDNDADDVYLNKYLSTLPSMSPLTRRLPPWEVHILPLRRRSLVLRFHHALGDCVSLLALLLSICDSFKEQTPVLTERKKKERSSFVSQVVEQVGNTWRACKKTINTFAYVLEQDKLVKIRNEDVVFVAQGGGLDTRPRKLASLVLSLDDIRIVKSKLNAKINDVFVGVVTYGISKYLKSKSSHGRLVSTRAKCHHLLQKVNPQAPRNHIFGLHAVSRNAKISMKMAVNVRGEGSQDILRSIKHGKNIKWGNKFGYFMLQIDLEKSMDDPLDYVRKAKDLLDEKKTSSEDQYSHYANDLVTHTFGMEPLASYYYKARHNTSLFMSNIVGPSNPVSLARNQILKMGVTLSTLPAVMDVHMISYNEKAFLQFLVAEEIIPDPELLSQCVKESLAEMLSSVMKSKNTSL